jgi:hypothetical protein
VQGDIGRLQAVIVRSERDIRPMRRRIDGVLARIQPLSTDQSGSRSSSFERTATPAVGDAAVDLRHPCE